MAYAQKKLFFVGEGTISIARDGMTIENLYKKELNYCIYRKKVVPLQAE